MPACDHSTKRPHPSPAGSTGGWVGALLFASVAPQRATVQEPIPGPRQKRSGDPRWRGSVRLLDEPQFVALILFEQVGSRAVERHGQGQHRAGGSPLGVTAVLVVGLETDLRLPVGALAPLDLAGTVDTCGDHGVLLCYLQPGSSTVCPGGWHFAPGSLGPCCELPGPKSGSANAAGVAAPSTPSATARPARKRRVRIR